MRSKVNDGQRECKFHECWCCKVKISIESFAEDQYDISVATHQKADVDSFIKNLRGEQIQLVLNQGETIIMCSEFADLPATLKCEDLGIFFGGIFWDKTFNHLGNHFVMLD